MVWSLFDSVVVVVVVLLIGDTAVVERGSFAWTTSSEWSLWVFVWSTPSGNNILVILDDDSLNGWWFVRSNSTELVVECDIKRLSVLLFPWPIMLVLLLVLVVVVVELSDGLWSDCDNDSDGCCWFCCGEMLVVEVDEVGFVWRCGWWEVSWKSSCVVGVIWCLS